LKDGNILLGLEENKVVSYSIKGKEKVTYKTKSFSRAVLQLKKTKNICVGCKNGEISIFNIKGKLKNSFTVIIKK
jgi:hypothetical protein